MTPPLISPWPNGTYYPTNWRLISPASIKVIGLNLILEHLEWEFRKALYKQELLRINADIYFLEEIDHPEEICGLLPKDEYNSHYL